MRQRKVVALVMCALSEWAFEVFDRILQTPMDSRTALPIFKFVLRHCLVTIGEYFPVAICYCFSWINGNIDFRHEWRDC